VREQGSAIHLPQEVERVVVELVLVASVLLQFAAAFFAIRLIRITGKRQAWAWIVMAVLLMVVRRAITLYRLFIGDVSLLPDLAAELVALVSSASMVIGMAYIAPLFLSIKLAEEKMKEYSEKLEEMVEERTEELREAQEQLVRRERLAVLGQLAGGIGHERRIPLGAIKTAAYFLNMVLEEQEPDVKDTLEILEKEVATSERIISSLLDFARPKPPTRRKVDVNEVVRETLSRVTAPERVEITSQLDRALPMILADPVQLGQVFRNLILNAIQAMPEGGQLTVKSELAGPE